MFFILSKILDFLLAPIIWILLTLLAAYFLKSRRALLTGIILLFIFSNNFLVNEAFLLWERKPVILNGEARYQVAVVLSGFTKTRTSTPGRVHFNKGADRLLHTVSLFKEGKIEKILISGGSGSLINRDFSEARQLRRAFLYTGVPDSCIIVEGKSSNTVENARFSADTLRKLADPSKILLVTSAFHIRRAEACFIKAGIRPAIYPVDFYSKERRYHPADFLIPSDDAMNKWSILIHEVAGFMVYKVIGYC